MFHYNQDKLGKGEAFFSWQPKQNWLCIAGDNRVLIFIDRLGKKREEFPLRHKGKVKQIEFDFEGDTVAILQEKCNIVTVYNVELKKSEELDLDKSNKDLPSFIKWGLNHSSLAIGTEAGLIYFYDKKTDKIIPSTMNHSKKVISAAWNENGLLATAAIDQSLAVTERNGDVVVQGIKTTGEPKRLTWARQKTDDIKNQNKYISVVVDNKYPVIHPVYEKKKPVELKMDKTYGEIVSYRWFGDGYIAFGFSRGHIVIISSHMNEINTEIHSSQAFKAGLDDFDICESASRLAVAGENTIKVYSLDNWAEIPEERIDLPGNCGRVSKLEWSKNGQLLIASTYLGHIFAFNVVVNERFSLYKNQFAHMSTLNQVVISEVSSSQIKQKHTVKFEDEPDTFCISGQHVAASFGSKLKIYSKSSSQQVITKSDIVVNEDFGSRMDSIMLSKEYIALLSENKVYLVRISDFRTEKIIPARDTDEEIRAACLTEYFLSVADSANRVRVYSLSEDFAQIAEYKFENEIRSLFPNQIGTLIGCVDILGKAYIFSPVNESVIPIPSMSDVQTVIWDHKLKTNFVAVNKTNYSKSYVYVDSSLYGETVKVLKEYNAAEGRLVTRNGPREHSRLRNEP